MRFFADHCVPESTAITLEAKGHEVLRLRNQMATDAPDTDVIPDARVRCTDLGGDRPGYPHPVETCHWRVSTSSVYQRQSAPQRFASNSGLRRRSP